MNIKEMCKEILETYKRANREVEEMLHDNLFLGHPIEFWMELKRKADSLQVADLIDENAILRAKVSYYENRLDDMDRFRKRVTLE